MFDRVTLKSRAKAVLSRSFLTMFFACLIVSLISGGAFGLNSRNFENLNVAEIEPLRLAAILGVLGIMSILAILFSIFVTAPLSVGLKYFMLRAADSDAKIDYLLYPFKNGYLNIVFTLFMKNLYIFLWSLVGFIPLALIIGTTDAMEKISSLTSLVQANSVGAALSLSGIMSGIFILTLIFSIPALIKTLQYSMTEYILADNPTTKKSIALSKSKEMMAGNKWGYVKLRLSFLGWEILASVTCCIGALILAPYVEQTFAQLYLELSGQGKDYSDFTAQQNNPFGF